MSKRALYSLVVILLLVTFSYAQVPQLINYQAVIYDKAGKPLNGTYTVIFSIYKVETGGSSLWTETKKVTVEDGLFSVLLGSVNPIPYSAFKEDLTYLELKVGSDPVMTPRKRIVSVAYAFHANDADHLNGYAEGDFVKSVDGVNPSSGNVDLVAGTNVTIAPDAANHRITISATGGGGAGDNLGNHIATQNIRLNNNWLSNDGGDEGISVGNTGSVSIPGSITSHGDITTSADVQGNNVRAITNLQANGGYIRTGTPSVEYGEGDIVATDEIVADNTIRTGSPTITTYGSGDIAATDDIIADGDAYIGNNLRVWKHAGINANGGYNTTYALYVYGDGACTGSWLDLSDGKFKTNIMEIENPLSLVLKLNGITYQFKTEEYKDREFPKGRQYGLIAQEVEKVIPEVVHEDENGEKAIAYSKLVPVLIEAIKQQQKSIEDLQNQINQLKNR